MNALFILLPALCLMAIAYRYYSAFLATKVAVLDDLRVTPAHTKYDGHNYHPMGRWVLFGHHFAAITGAGPLIGPVLAAQFGFLPGLLWLVIGVCLAGAVHDFMILWASTRRGGRSLAEIARDEIGPVAGFTTAVAILFIIIIALAGLGLAVVNALRDSAWGVFTIGTTIPIAILMGLYMYRWRRGAIRSATIVRGARARGRRHRGPLGRRSSMGARLRAQRRISSSSPWPFTGSQPRCCPSGCCSRPAITCQAFMKIGTIAFLILGVIIVQSHAADAGPVARSPMAADRSYRAVSFRSSSSRSPVAPISGFHALIGSGHDAEDGRISESDIRPIGYGAMLVEGVVGHRGADRGRGALSGRLLRDQRAASRSSLTLGIADSESRELSRRRSARMWQAGPAGRSRWPSGWRRSSRRSRACAG